MSEDKNKRYDAAIKKALDAAMRVLQRPRVLRQLALLAPPNDATVHRDDCAFLSRISSIDVHACTCGYTACYYKLVPVCPTCYGNHDPAKDCS